MISTDLLTAVQNADRDFVERALQAGANPNARDASDTSLLHWAVQQDHPSIVELLVQGGADINEISDDMLTHLSNAAGDGNLTMVQTLIAHGAAVDIGTPLHTAIAYGHADIAQYLLDQGADINARDPEGKTPLFFAAMYGHDDVARLLLARGADKDIQDETGRRAIDEATDAFEEARTIYDSISTLLK